MELCTDSPNTHYYTKIRGAINVADVIKDGQNYLSGYFIQEYTKQISPQVAQILNTEVSRLNRRGGILISQNLGYNVAIPYDGIWYFRADFDISNYFSTVWCTCCSDKDFDPWTVDESVSLNFKVVFSLPQMVIEKANEHILTRPKKDEEARLKDEELYNRAIKRTDIASRWVDYLGRLIFR